MKLDWLSTQAQDGLMQWAKFQHDDELLFDAIGSAPEEWSWLTFELQAAADKPEWFPRGKWATIQTIQTYLLEEAIAARRAA